MPRIDEKVLDTVFYLYATVDDAKAGAGFGGTGFLVFFPSTDGGENSNTNGWLYAVTNWHVAVRDGFSVLRINSRAGPPDILEFGPEDWVFDPRFDVAILPISLHEKTHKFSVVATRIFTSDFMAANSNIGPGDDVFMAGRFVDHDGGETNKPAVRFGHISINPTPMPQGPSQYLADCYCIDVHSRTGYSGSPVFVYRTPGNTLEDMDRGGMGARQLLTGGINHFSLLGIHFGQFPELWEIEKAKQTPVQEGLTKGAAPDYVVGMSGMTCVIPSWTIAGVLNMPELKKKRGGKELKLTFGHHSNRLPDSPKIVEESALPPTDANPNAREDFMRLANAAARKQKPDE